MSRKALMSAVTILVLATASQVSTAQAEDASAPKPPALTLDLPSKLMGSDCHKSEFPDGAKATICMSADFMKAGLVGVTVAPAQTATYEQLVEQMRESFHESGSLRIVSEEHFAPATAPDAVGLRAEYQTGAGRKYVWSVSRDGAFTRVLVTVLGRRERSTIEPEILEKVFGADRYPPRAEAAAAPQEAVNP